MVGNRLGSKGLLAAFGAALAFATVLLWAAGAQSAPKKAFDLQAHRGGLGLRPESTLSAFGTVQTRLGSGWRSVTVRGYPCSTRYAGTAPGVRPRTSAIPSHSRQMSAITSVRMASCPRRVSRK